MANIKSAIKRARQNEKLRRHNSAQRSTMRTAVKKVLNAVNLGDAEKAQQAYQNAQPVLDKAVGKGLIHKNKAARTKSRLVARIKLLSEKAA